MVAFIWGHHKLISNNQLVIKGKIEYGKVSVLVWEAEGLNKI